MGMSSQRHSPAALLRERYELPIVQEAGWARVHVWTGAENLAPPGIDPLTVQSVTSRDTDWSMPVHGEKVWFHNFTRQMPCWNLKQCIFYPD